MDFRPISMVESGYKIIFKLLANRIKSVIRSLTNETQCAFISDRKIIDEVFVSN